MDLLLMERMVMRINLSSKARLRRERAKRTRRRVTKMNLLVLTI